MNSSQYLRKRSDNMIHTAMIFMAMAGLLLLVGWLLFGSQTIWWLTALVIIGFALRPRMDNFRLLKQTGARPLSPYQVPHIYQILAGLAQRAGLPSVPNLYVIANPSQNAFTMGRAHQSVIVLTDGLLRQLNPREMAGVLAHEISHITNQDTKVLMLADAAARLTRGLAAVGQILLLVNIPLLLIGEASISMIAILLLLTAPLISSLLYLALSRTREYRADMDAARLTGDPMGLALALQKIERRQVSLFQRLFSRYMKPAEHAMVRSHPHSYDRIRRLTALSNSGQMPDVDSGQLPLAPQHWHLSLL